VVEGEGEGGREEVGSGEDIVCNIYNGKKKKKMVYLRVLFSC